MISSLLLPISLGYFICHFEPRAELNPHVHYVRSGYIPVILQVASLLAALTHPGHIVIYAPGDSLPCRRDAS
ncbi:hypothetical protein CKY02_17315 [Photorhabdus bodei]|uniref:Uncharacterized protein n=1 Tax=Photorhabdus bodei TaxID=2029681 RepID=A0A329X0W9_9GAMM|nr:hypothetical protein CKY02_17315 [Photorhabdus bodei]